MSATRKKPIVIEATEGRERNYGTDSEKAFLESMVTNPKGKGSAVDLLRGYMKAAEQRKEWGPIDKVQVLAHATSLLGNALAAEQADRRIIVRRFAR